jgi:hypothetical protein
MEDLNRFLGWPLSTRVEGGFFVLCDTGCLPAFGTNQLVRFGLTAYLANALRKLIIITGKKFGINSGTAIFVAVLKKILL